MASTVTGLCTRRLHFLDEFGERGSIQRHLGGVIAGDELQQYVVGAPGSSQRGEDGAPQSVPCGEGQALLPGPP